MDAGMVVRSVVVVLILSYCPDPSNSHSDGAPDSVCTNMIPGHSGQPQLTPCPYKIQLSATEVKGGESLPVKLTSGVPFKGFFAIGVPKSSLSSTLKPMGEMVNIASNGQGPEIQSVKCGSGGGITHADSSEKFSVDFEWKAPNEEGDYVILTSFVKDYGTFWVKESSPVIRVTRGSAEKPPKTTVEEAPHSGGLSAAVESKLLPFYEGCGKVKGCFGLPDGCIPDKKCEMFTSWRVDGANYRFQVAGKIPEPIIKPGQGHVSMGLSFDDKMGEDAVVGCVLKDGVVQPKSYYNYPNGKQNSGFENEFVGLIEKEGDSVDGWLLCSFSRDPKFKMEELNNTVFDLENDKYHILLARASKMDINKDNRREKVGFHKEVRDRGSSATAYHMTDYGVAGGASDLLVKLHGSFMIIAWIMTASLGIFVARYYKQTHTDFNPFNKGFWFVLHVGSMIFTITLTLLGAIFILCEIQGYSSNITREAGRAHPILGFIVVGIVCLQLTLGLLRPHPGTPKRPLFNWVHWLGGTVGHTLGIACIFLASELSKSGVESSYPWVLTMGLYVLFYVLMHGTLSIHTLWADKQMGSGDKLRGVSLGPMKPSKPEEAPGTTLRTFLLLFYIVGLVIFGAVLINFVVKANGT